MTTLWVIYLVSLVTIYVCLARVLLKKDRNFMRTWGDLLFFLTMGLLPIMNTIIALMLVWSSMEPFFNKSLWK